MVRRGAAFKYNEIENMSAFVNKLKIHAYKITLENGELISQTFFFYICGAAVRVIRKILLRSVNAKQLFLFLANFSLSQGYDLIFLFFFFWSTQETNVFFFICAMIIYFGGCFFYAAPREQPTVASIYIYLVRTYPKFELYVNEMRFMCACAPMTHSINARYLLFLCGAG